MPAALLGCGALLLVSMTLGVAVGSVPLSPATVLRVIADHLEGHAQYSVADAIVWDIRLPRVLLAAVIGATLTTAGTVVQVLVRNALADPFLLGVSSGASVGATAVLLFGAFASLGVWAISVGSVLGALGAMAAVFLVARSGRALSPTQLILCGVVLSALFGFTVPDGGFAGLLGPNGSGKSTILKAIYRVHRPAAGRVLLDGADLLVDAARGAARRVAVVAQETTVEFDFTVCEMVMIGRTPHKRAFERDDDARPGRSRPRPWSGSAARELAHRSFNTLSGGEKQRVLIARAMAQGADHLILDEPTNHLDIRYQVEVLELVAGLGVTVLAALHDLSLAALFCDTVLPDRRRAARRRRPPADGDHRRDGPRTPTAPTSWSSTTPRPAPRTSSRAAPAAASATPSGNRASAPARTAGRHPT